MKILQQVKNLVNASCDYMAKVNTVAELSQLSDEQLADIGMRRDHYNMQLTKVWNDADSAPAVAANTQAAKPTSDFGQRLVSLYSGWNRPSYVV